MATKELDTLLSCQDTGPTQLALLELLKKCSFNNYTDDINIQDLLGFIKHTEDLNFNIRSLTSWVESVNVRKTTGVISYTAIVTQAVSSWIFHSNAVESAGLSEADTMEIVVNGSKGNERSQLEVTQTLELLRKTYNSTDFQSSDLRPLLFDAVRLQEWHRQMFFEFPEYDPGSFRRVGACVINQNGTCHYFPHHKLVIKAVNKLSAVVSKLAHCIAISCYSFDERMRYAFALAAFAQFHFVDIHPFKNGNGRMCRFISKRILDWVLPVPFPMFPQRNRYLHALEQCRKCESPAPLAELLIKICVAYYKTILPEYDYFLVGGTVESIRLQANDLRLPEEAVQIALKRWEALDDEKETTVQVQEVQIRVKKSETVDFYLDDV